MLLYWNYFFFWLYYFIHTSVVQKTVHCSQRILCTTVFQQLAFLIRPTIKTLQPIPPTQRKRKHCKSGGVCEVVGVPYLYLLKVATQAETSLSKKKAIPSAMQHSPYSVCNFKLGLRSWLDLSWKPVICLSKAEQ